MENIGKMLRENERAYLELERPRYINKRKPNRIRKHDSDIRKKALKAIEYLTYLAEKLVPDQHEQIFNEQTIKPLIDTLFWGYPKKWVWKERKKKQKSIIHDVELFRLAVATANTCLNCAVQSIDAKYRMMVAGTRRRLFPEKTDLNILTTLYYHPQLGKIKSEK